METNTSDEAEDALNTDCTEFFGRVFLEVTVIRVVILMTIMLL